MSAMMIAQVATVVGTFDEFIPDVRSDVLAIPVCKDPATAEKIFRLSLALQRISVIKCSKRPEDRA